MELQKELSDMLDHILRPAFSVQNNIICKCNQAAEGLLLTAGTDIRTLLLTGSTEYEQFTGGCLYLNLALSSKGYGATVTKAGELDLFILDPKPGDTGLRTLALAARELRSPLSNMIIATESLFKHTPEDPSIKELLSRLNRSLYQMYRLVNNMSDAGSSSTLSSEGMHDLGRMIYGFFEKIQTQLSGTNIDLTYEGLNEEVYGLANEQQLERAILNVISNAMKFMPQGGTIHAQLVRRGRMLHLSIQDNGSGIADNILCNIFSRYQRQPDIEDSRYGIGLGMVLIRSAASDHGGTVLVDQPEGKGTRITMTLAIRQDPVSSLSSQVFRPIVFSDHEQILLELSGCLPLEYYAKE